MTLDYLPLTPSDFCWVYIRINVGGSRNTAAYWQTLVCTELSWRSLLQTLFHGNPLRKQMKNASALTAGNAKLRDRGGLRPHSPAFPEAQGKAPGDCHNVKTMLNLWSPVHQASLGSKRKEPPSSPHSMTTLTKDAHWGGQSSDMLKCCSQIKHLHRAKDVNRWNRTAYLKIASSRQTASLISRFSLSTLDLWVHDWQGKVL